MYTVKVEGTNEPKSVESSYTEGIFLVGGSIEDWLAPSLFTDGGAYSYGTLSDNVGRRSNIDEIHAHRAVFAVVQLII